MIPAPGPAIPATTHLLLTADARRPGPVVADSVDLVVTSPPYPMIAMWDEAFRRADAGIGRALDAGDGPEAFRGMHAELNQAWSLCLRAVKPGGFLCINIGDAVRTVNGSFRLYPNHALIESFFQDHGADPLPRIIWRKPTNAPNKFMGSGMLPAGAYVTLEHEYILIFRKRGKRIFSSAAEKIRRAHSALFWEERNDWYSDLWEIGGARQRRYRIQAGDLSETDVIPTRVRSGAFPFEIAYRLIAMHSLQGDLVYDPFLGTGTTAFAAAALGRHSLGTDIDPAFIHSAERELTSLVPALAGHNRERLERHRSFVRDHEAAGKTLAHTNERYGFPVKTRQEKNLVMPVAAACLPEGAGKYRVEYET